MVQVSNCQNSRLFGAATDSTMRALLYKQIVANVYPKSTPGC
jgi:hypothetical protein